jgi:aspartyl protease family protein
MEDRDWWRNAQKERELKRISERFKAASSQAPMTGKGSLRWGPFWIVMFWLLVMGVLYMAMSHYLKPGQLVVTATGELVIPRAKDGHFYAQGFVNGKSANFMVDTGATLVTVSDQFAREAGLAWGETAVFQTANGEITGRVVAGVPVTVGPTGVSGVKVAVGFVGYGNDSALLGQSFLSKFDVILQKDQMILRKR